MNIPASAQRFADAAIAAGMTVTHDTSGPESWTVNVVSPSGSTASVIWSVANVAGNNSRLGFATEYKAGVRFDYANVYLAYPVTFNGKSTHYPPVGSVAKVRQYLGF